MKANDSVLLYGAIPVVSELNRVPGFDPLRFLKKTPNGPVMELRYKKLWFRLRYPQGRLKLSALKITDQLAIIEARVFFDKDDPEPKASFTAQSDIATAPGGLYVEAAQHAAIDQALTDAGFGIQFVPDCGTAETEPADPVLLPVPGVPAAAPAAEEKPAEPVAEEPHEEEAPEYVTGEYTNEMSVEEICARMTLEEAENYIVPLGTCNGQTMAQVADRRPASLRYYMTGYNGDNNILRAAATLVHAHRSRQAS